MRSHQCGFLDVIHHNHGYAIGTATNGNSLATPWQLAIPRIRRVFRWDTIFVSIHHPAILRNN